MTDVTFGLDDDEMLDLPDESLSPPQPQCPSDQPTQEQPSQPKHERITAPADEPIEVELKKILDVPSDISC